MIESTIASVAEEAASAGAEIIDRYFKDLSSAQVAYKSSGQQHEGLVTAADVESEQAIVDIIGQSYPDHRVMAEEDHTDTDADTAEHLWVIDPLDGTNNFAHGIPHFAISIAYYYRGAATYGIVVDVGRSVTYQCGAGQGAWCDGNRVSVNDHQSLDQTIVGVGFYYDRGEMMKATLGSIEKLFQADVHGIRRFGTAALDLIQVGMGRFGGFFEYTLSPWDFAAGRLFVEEAGGKITTCAGDPLPLKRSSLLASNGQLHDHLLKIVSGYTPDNRTNEALFD